MKKSIKISVAAVAVLAAIMMIVTLGGCTGRIASNLVEKAIENAAAEQGEDIDIDLEEGEVNITDEEGNEFSIGGTELPDDWPSAVPVNGDIAIQFAGKNTTDNKQSWTISGTFSGGAEDLYQFYKGEFASWTQDSDSSSESDGLKSYYYQVSNDTYVVSMIISDTEDQGVTVIQTVSEK
jgi:hypothetical protein